MSLGMQAQVGPSPNGPRPSLGAPGPRCVQAQVGTTTSGPSLWCNPRRLCPSAHAPIESQTLALAYSQCVIQREYLHFRTTSNNCQTTTCSNHCSRDLSSYSQSGAFPVTVRCPSTMPLWNLPEHGKSPCRSLSACPGVIMIMMPAAKDINTIVPKCFRMLQSLKNIEGLMGLPWEHETTMTSLCCQPAGSQGDLPAYALMENIMCSTSPSERTQTQAPIRTQTIDQCPKLAMTKATHLRNIHMPWQTIKIV